MIPEFDTTLPPLVPNWLTSPLKLGAQLSESWEWSELITYRESNESKLDKDQGDRCLNVITSSSVTILSLGSVILTQIALYVRVDKENSLESLLICCTLLIHLSLFVCIYWSEHIT